MQSPLGLRFTSQPENQRWNLTCEMESTGEMESHLRQNSSVISLPSDLEPSENQLDLELLTCKLVPGYSKLYVGLTTKQKQICARFLPRDAYA